MATDKHEEMRLKFLEMSKQFKWNTTKLPKPQNMSKNTVSAPMIDSKATKSEKDDSGQIPIHSVHYRHHSTLLEISSDDDDDDDCDVDKEKEELIPRIDAENTRNHKPQQLPLRGVLLDLCSSDDDDDGDIQHLNASFSSILQPLHCNENTNTNMITLSAPPTATASVRAHKSFDASFKRLRMLQEHNVDLYHPINRHNERGRP